MSCQIMVIIHYKCIPSYNYFYLWMLFRMILFSFFGSTLISRDRQSAAQVKKMDTKKVKGTTECKDQNFLISFSFPFHNTFSVYLILTSTSAKTGSFTGTENCYCIVNLWPSHGQNVQASVCLGKKEFKKTYFNVNVTLNLLFLA